MTDKLDFKNREILHLVKKYDRYLFNFEISKCFTFSISGFFGMLELNLY